MEGGREGERARERFFVATSTRAASPLPSLLPSFRPCRLPSRISAIPAPVTIANPVGITPMKIFARCFGCFDSHRSASDKTMLCYSCIPLEQCKLRFSLIASLIISRRLPKTHARAGLDDFGTGSEDIDPRAQKPIPCLSPSLSLLFLAVFGRARTFRWRLRWEMFTRSQSVTMPQFSN